MIVGKVERLTETVLVSLKCFKMLCLVKLLFLSLEFGVFEEFNIVGNNSMLKQNIFTFD